MDKNRKLYACGEGGGREIRIKNPFLEDKRNQNSCFSELGTILLPACYQDLRLSSETPYEWENVNLNSFSKGCVLDLGANQGYFSVLAAALGHSVYAFEPSPKLIDNLKEYAREYDDKIQVVEAAAGDYCGEGELFIDAFSDDANSMILKTNAEKAEKIEVITIDAFARKERIEKIDFIKADIEGAERAMLKGARWVLKTHKPYLSICTYHLPDDPEVLSRIILEANPEYTIIQKEKKLYAYVEK